MTEHIKKMTNDELKKWLFINARSMGKSTATLLITEELIKRAIFDTHNEKTYKEDKQ